MVRLTYDIAKACTDLIADGCRYASSQCSSHGEALAGRLVANKRQYSSQSTQKPHSLSEPLRHLMRSLPAPIVVLTTTLPATDTSKDKKAHYRGMTLSSFTTLTLTPEPIVTFNIRSTPTEPSRTLAALEQSHNLLVHLLEDTAEGAGIAHGFTRGNEGDVFSTTKASVSEERTEYGLVLPRLTGKGIRRVLRCEILQQDESGNRDQRSTGNNSGLIRVGDHVLVVAQVKEILDSGLDPGTELAEGYGLSYADGKYRRVGDVIDPINYAAGL